MYAQRIHEKKFPSGARVLATLFPAHDSVSIVGSLVGGSQLASAYLKSPRGDEFAKIHAEMLLEGTRRHSKKQLQILLDTLGASVQFAATQERLVFSAKIRTPHLDALLSLIAEMLVQPAFPAAELEILKARELANLAYEAQDTRTQAQIALSRLIYPEGHPNSHESTDASRELLQHVTPRALSEFHKFLLSSSGFILSIAGDIEPTRVFSLAQKHFKSLPTQAVTLPGFKKATPGPRQTATVHIEHKANIDYLLGIATGVTKRDPEYPALVLGMQVLGNPGFTGRLMQTVREKEGLTYAVYANFSGAADSVDGNALVWASFAPELFAKGRAAIWREIKKLVREGAESREVAQHRSRFEASFRTRLSNSGAFAQAAHDTIADGYPLSYLDEFPKRILKLTAREVNAALKKYLIPQKCSEAAAGPVNAGIFETLDKEK